MQSRMRFHEAFNNPNSLRTHSLQKCPISLEFFDRLSISLPHFRWRIGLSKDPGRRRILLISNTLVGIPEYSSFVRRLDGTSGVVVDFLVY